MTRVLVLAGTAEARALCAALVATPGIDARAALAGATRDPAPYAVPLRTGGFGGPEGLAAHLRAEAVDALVDATHPFAARISQNAARAAKAAGVPLLRLVRPPWAPEPGEDWRCVPDLAAAAAVLPAGARAFLATGRGSAPAFLGRGDIAFLLRAIDPPAVPLPANWTLALGRPPFSLEAETAALASFAATHLVAKNAGGAPGRSKLTAAARLGLPIVMVARPVLPPATEVAGIDAALAWLAKRARIPSSGQKP